LEIELKKQLCKKALFSLLKEQQYSLFDDKIKNLCRADVQVLSWHPLIAKLHEFVGVNSTFFKDSHKLARVDNQGKYPFYEFLPNTNVLPLLTLVSPFCLIDQEVVFNTSVRQVSMIVNLKTIIECYGLTNQSSSRTRIKNLQIQLYESTIYL
jgi:hypothetical protein